jgi:hypothetical protein
MKEIVSVFWILSVAFSLLLNFNLIGALIINDWQWIMNNWLCDVGIVIFPICYLITHLMIIFGYKIAISILKNL